MGLKEFLDQDLVDITPAYAGVSRGCSNPHKSLRQIGLQSRDVVSSDQGEDALESL